MIIAPQKQYRIPYKINNPSDSNTYYVQSVITEAVSGRVLATLNLVNDGTNFWSALWNTPADPSGTGYQIIISTTVYADSNYSQVSLVYGTQVDDHIIKDIAGLRVPTAGPGNSVDYKRLEKLIRDIVLEIPKTEIPFQEKIDYDAVEDIVQRHKLVFPPPIDYSNHFEDLKHHITKNNKTEEIKNHVTEVTGKQVTIDDFKAHIEKLQQFINEFSEADQAGRNGMKQELQEMMERVNKRLSEPFSVEVRKPELKEKEPEEDNFNRHEGKLKKLFGVV